MLATLAKISGAILPLFNSSKKRQKMAQMGQIQKLKGQVVLISN